MTALHLPARRLPAFSVALRAWRMHLGLCRKAAAARLGISPRTLEMWELGRRPARELWGYVRRRIGAGKLSLDGKNDVDGATLKA